MHAYFHILLFVSLIVRTLFNRLYYLFKLVAYEHGNDSRRSFVCAESMVVSRACGGDTEKVLILVNRLYNSDKEKQELCVFVRSSAGIEQILSLIGRQRPVIMLSASVYAGERLFMKQADKAVSFGNLFHHFHGELIVVACYICCSKYGSQLMLSGSDLVMLGFGVNAEFPKLLVKLFHECRNSRLYASEIVILKLLAFRRFCAEKRTACKYEVFSCLIIFLIYKEIFLLRTDGSYNTSCGGISEETEHSERLFADILHGAQKRRFFIKHFSAV